MSPLYGQFFDTDMVDQCPPGGGMIVDIFAGGGGASTGIKMALGRSPDVALNHCESALAIHAANHPTTRHLCENVWHVDPRDVVDRRVDLAWFSPDCKHHSRAKGGKPREESVRMTGWSVVMWVERVLPRLLFVENVVEFADWGPLDDNGMPIQARKGETFQNWVKSLRRLGYRVEWRVSRACAYGVPTIRKRLLVIARRDDEPIVWPEATHGAPDDPAVIAGDMKPYPIGAECIDFSRPCPSIFDNSAEIMAQYGVKANRPLKPNTMRRIALGVQRYVIDHPAPFLVRFQGGSTGYPVHEPMPTITANSYIKRPGGAAPIGLAVPSLVNLTHGGRNEAITEPFRTITGANRDEKALMVAAFMAQNNTGVVGHDMREPVSTITNTGSHQSLVAAHLLSLKGSSRRSMSLSEPHPTVCAGGGHSALVAALMTAHTGTPYPSDQVTVTVGDQIYVIADIGMRMLMPSELYAAQGFPAGHIIDRGADGRKLTKTEQVSQCGNSVPPIWAKAHVEANCGFML